MATLNATALSASANSYATLTEINAHLQQRRLFTDEWDTAASPTWTDWVVNDPGATLSEGSTSIPVDGGSGTLEAYDIIQFAGHSTEYEVAAFSASPLVLQSGLTAVPADDEAITKVGDATQVRAAIWAAALLDRMFEWKGGVATVNQQSMRWPRLGVIDQDGEEYSSSTVPQLIKDAQAELAFELVLRDRFREPELLGQGFTSAALGPLRVTVDPKQVLSWIPEYIVAMLAHVGTLIPEATRGDRVAKLYRS